MSKNLGIFQKQMTKHTPTHGRIIHIFLINGQQAILTE